MPDTTDNTTDNTPNNTPNNPSQDSTKTPANSDLPMTLEAPTVHSVETAVYDVVAAEASIASMPEEEAPEEEAPETEATPSLFGVSVREDGVAVVTFRLSEKGPNTLRGEFSAAFDALLTRLETNSAIKAVVLASDKPDFIVGADIKMLARVKTAAEGAAISRAGQESMNRLNGMTLPIVAAIHGQCLGGGLELALACHARVISDSPKTQLALPEVQLGLLPGACGTQRLPALIGAQSALDMMLTGRKIRPSRALKMGLVDEVVPKAILVEAAARRALKMASGETGKKRPFNAQRAALEKTAAGRFVLFQQARKALLAKTFGNYPAAERIIDAVQAGIEGGFEAGMKVEAEHFGGLSVSLVSKQLLGIFFATTALKKDTGVDDTSISAKPVHRVGVLGAGLMGAGIAYTTTSRCRIPVRLKDRDEDSVARGLKGIHDTLQSRVRRRALTKHEAAIQIRRITGTTDLSGFTKCDMVIEAVFEDLSLKHKLLKEVESLGNPNLIFASNTSSIPITQIAAESARPENVIGLHYFSPVEKMPLLEIIVTEKTSPQVTATCVAFGKKQGKTVIVVRDGVGFYTSRVLSPYMNEAAFLIMEGVKVEMIDGALKRWGFPVGPITLMDEVGIDVGAKIGPIMVEAFGERMQAPEAFGKLVESGRKGRKNKSGFYTYGEKKKQVDVTVYSVLGVTPDLKMDETLIVERCVFSMMNEAARCLEEGILRSARDGDIGAVFGLGFPAFLGGPFRHMDTLGAAEVVRKLRRFVKHHGERFEPAQILLDMAESGAKFYA